MKNCRAFAKANRDSTGKNSTEIRSSILFLNQFADLDDRLFTLKGTFSQERWTLRNIGVFKRFSTLKPRQDLPIKVCRKTAPGGRKVPEGLTGGRLFKGSPRGRDVALQNSPQGVTQGRSQQYGHKHKHISTNQRS